MTDIKTFRHILDRESWTPIFTEFPYVHCVNGNSDKNSYIYCNTQEQARAVACVPEMLNLIHEMMFALDKDSRKDYFKRGSEILEYVYDI